MLNQFAGNRGSRVAGGMQPHHGRRDAAATPRLGEAIAENRLHLRGVTLTQAARRQAEQQPITVHLTPVGLANGAAARGLRRDRAVLTRALKRSVSAATARCPAR